MVISHPPQSEGSVPADQAPQLPSQKSRETRCRRAVASAHAQLPAPRPRGRGDRPPAAPRPHAQRGGPRQARARRVQAAQRAPPRPRSAGRRHGEVVAEHPQAKSAPARRVKLHPRATRQRLRRLVHAPGSPAARTTPAACRGAVTQSLATRRRASRVSSTQQRTYQHSTRRRSPPRLRGRLVEPQKAKRSPQETRCRHRRREVEGRVAIWEGYAASPRTS